MHPFFSRFIWDVRKNELNKKKHNITFEQAMDLWNDPFAKNLSLPHREEERQMFIGKLDDKLWSAIFTFREEKIRLISVRRARIHEKKFYENN